MSEEKKIKVVMLEPDKLARTAEIDTSLKNLQRVIEGRIETFYPFREQVCIVCNDESKINGMKPNRAVCRENGQIINFIFGPAFICGCSGKDFGSLSDEQLVRYSKMFRYPQKLVKLDGEIIGIPFLPPRERDR